MVEDTTVTGNGFGPRGRGYRLRHAGQPLQHHAQQYRAVHDRRGVLLSYKNNSVNGNITVDGALTGIIGQQ
jgi:hypothetical protein